MVREGDITINISIFAIITYIIIFTININSFTITINVFFAISDKRGGSFFQGRFSGRFFTTISMLQT